AHFWYATNAGRWGQTKGVLRSLFLLPEVKRGMETALELDPRFPPAYSLAGTVYYEVPGLFGGDLEKSEALFRKGLEVDPRFTGLRVGLARTLIKRGRAAEAKRELQAVLDEKAPSNVADWTLKDSREARALLDSLGGRSCASGTRSAGAAGPRRPGGPPRSPRSRRAGTIRSGCWSPASSRCARRTRPPGRPRRACSRWPTHRRRCAGSRRARSSAPSTRWASTAP